MVKILQASFLLGALLLSYLLGILTGQFATVRSPCAASNLMPPRQSPAKAGVMPADPLANHRAYLECTAIHKICRDDHATWTPEETAAYVKAAVGRVGGEITGESP